MDTEQQSNISREAFKHSYDVADIATPEFWEKAKEKIDNAVLASPIEGITDEQKDMLKTHMRMAFAAGALVSSLKEGEGKTSKVEDVTKGSNFFTEEQLDQLKQLYPLNESK